MSHGTVNLNSSVWNEFKPKWSQLKDGPNENEYPNRKILRSLNGGSIVVSLHLTRVGGIQEWNGIACQNEPPKPQSETKLVEKKHVAQTMETLTSLNKPWTGRVKGTMLNAASHKVQTGNHISGSHPVGVLRLWERNTTRQLKPQQFIQTGSW